MKWKSQNYVANIRNVLLNNKLSISKSTRSQGRNFLFM